ncbi:hypothetical protein, partial [Salinispora arenicola]|uniref:hypothetical protein n=1 Tax=Salinispora arenicola TaxID=168697 RepID=UPI000577C6F8
IGWLPGGPCRWLPAVLLAEAAGVAAVVWWAARAPEGVLHVVRVSEDPQLQMVGAWCCGCWWVTVLCYDQPERRSSAVAAAWLLAETHEASADCAGPSRLAAAGGDATVQPTF